MSMARKQRDSKNSARRLKFNEKLVLNQWLLSLFEVKSLAELSDNLKDPDLEQYDENNISHYYHQLTNRASERAQLTNQTLLAYDENIFKHTHSLNQRRSEPIRWKYFQYLALLF